MNVNVENATVGASRAAVASTFQAKYVKIKAHTANSGDIYVGDSTVTTANGFQLDAGEEFELGTQNPRGVQLVDLANLYVVGSVAGQNYSILYY